jgi:N-acetylmuramoyl-L-alanine amidase
VVADQAVNARGGPGTEYDVVGQLTAGQAYSVVGQNGEWWRISMGDGRAAWVAKGLVAFSGSEAVPTVAAPPTSAPPPAAGSAPHGLPLNWGSRWVHSYVTYAPAAFRS